MNERKWKKIITEVKFTFSRSSGPGGQHVNTSDTKVELKWAFKKSEALNLKEKGLVEEKLKSYLNKQFTLCIKSSRFRSRERNKVDCLDRLRFLLKKAFYIPKKRIATKPTRASVERRIENKKKKSDQKKSRKKVET